LRVFLAKIYGASLKAWGGTIFLAFFVNLICNKSTMTVSSNPKTTHSNTCLSGIGLGLRRDLIDILQTPPEGFRPAFLEFAPENWMGIGGFWKKKFKAIVEQYKFTTHGLSLSLGSPEPLDMEFLGRLKQFFAEYPVEIFSEHLSYTKCDNAHLLDLLPIPFREDAVNHLIQRIGIVQDFLGRRIAIENVSYYSPVAAEMSEAEFISAIVKGSDCSLLLDVNNVYVNSFNHSYDPYEFIASLPLDAVAYVHMAGHEQRTPTLIIDTHGHPIIDPVFDLFEWVLPQIPPVPVLLERDFNFPEFSELQAELSTLASIYAKQTGKVLAQDSIGELQNVA
jgi:uncharacterized protein